MNINHVTVIGTGMMGSQITLHLLNSGMEVDWVKVTTEENEISLSKNQHKYFNKRLFVKETINRLNYRTLNGILADQEALETDLVIEAIIEDAEAKENVYRDIATLLKPETILATNTSSISVEKLATHMPISLQERFIGMHFFTPVRKSQLIELIPHKEFDQTRLLDVQNFIIYRLGKNYITANDVTGFVANRIGFYSNTDIMQRAEAEGLSVSDADAISGVFIGRTKMGPYRLSDYTNIYLSQVATEQYRADPTVEPFFKERTAHNFLIDKGWIGDSVGQGYYKKIEGERYVINFDKQEYDKVEPAEFDILDKFKKKDLVHNLNVIFEAEDQIGKFMWKSLRNVMYFAAINVGYATENFKDIDRALVWGYNWQRGPFELWDTIGFERVRKRMVDELGDLPEWIQEKTGNFYQEDSLQLVGRFQDVQTNLLAHTDNVSSIYTTDDGVLIYTIETENNVINTDLLTDILETVKVLEKESYQGLVITTKGKNFSVGYDINAMTSASDNETIEESLKYSIDLGHKTVSAVKYAKKPIISAVRGYVLGGGAELAMQSYEVVAANETQIGLVESQIGIIPGGGGLTELADRIYRTNLSRLEKKLQMQKAFQTVGFGKRSNNAVEGIVDGYLKPQTSIVHHSDLILEVALDRVRQLNKSGFIPVQKARYEVFGNDFIATMVGQINNWKSGDFLTDYQGEVLKAVAYVLSGGDVPMGTTLTQDNLLRIEAEKYIALATSEESYKLMSEKMK